MCCWECLGSAWCSEIISSLRTHLGSWLPLLPLRSSPPRAALPVGHKEHHHIYCTLTWGAELCELHCPTLKDVSFHTELKINRDKMKINWVVQEMQEREEERNSPTPPWPALGAQHSFPAERDEVLICLTSLQLPLSGSMLRQCLIWTREHTGEGRKGMLTSTLLWNPPQKSDMCWDQGQTWLWETWLSSASA